MQCITKPHGGYRLIPMKQLCVVWSAYRNRSITWLAFRVYLSLHEVAARREAAERSAKRTLAPPHWPVMVNDVQQLVGCARPTQVRASVAMLDRLDVISRDGGVCETPANPNAVPHVAEMIERMGRKGTVPVPRQVIRYLAAEGSAATAAYMLAVVIRCCHIRGRGVYRTRGRCSTRWVSEWFGVHQRSIKRAAATVRSLGWITEIGPRDRWTQRHGPVITINIGWRWSCTETPLRTPPIDTEMTPPNKKQELLTDPMNQEGQVVAAAGSESSVQPIAQAMKNIARAELRDLDRLLKRYAHAVREGLVDDSPSGKLKFVAAAHHARRVAHSNACGLFSTVIRRQHWAFISQADEDQARSMLARADRRQLRSSPAADVGRLIEDVTRRLSWPTSKVVKKTLTTPATCSNSAAGPSGLLPKSCSRCYESLNRPATGAGGS
jgi:hypothetical protein